jgi:transposase-like protein
MTKSVKRYSEAFRRQVVSEYEAGASENQLRKKYGIGGKQTIQRWIKKYASEGLRHDLMRVQLTDEVNRIKDLEQRVEELEQALGKTTLEKIALESIVEELQLRDPEGIKKNERPSSNDVSRKEKGTE